MEEKEKLITKHSNVKSKVLLSLNILIAILIAILLCLFAFTAFKLCISFASLMALEIINQYPPIFKTIEHNVEKQEIIFICLFAILCLLACTSEKLRLISISEREKNIGREFWY